MVKKKGVSVGNPKKKKSKAATGKYCPKCKKYFSTPYSMQRHLKKKFKCDKRSLKKREAEKKEKHKARNKAYYTRRKWGISLTRMSTAQVMDRLLAKIPGSEDAEVESLSERLRALKQDQATSTSSDHLLAKLNARLNALKTK